MQTRDLHRALLAASCVAAPLAGLVAAVATPALTPSRAEEITAIAAAPGRFYTYAIGILLSSYLLVPAVFGLLSLVRSQRPGWSLAATVVAQTGMLIAIGDAATELMYWQMGARGADHEQMAALAERYENSSRVSAVYNLGGLATLIGVVMIAVLLWRAHALARWAAAALPLGAVCNILGFGTASRPLLVGSYVLIAACFFPAAAVIAAKPKSVGTGSRDQATGSSTALSTSSSAPA